MFFPFTTQVYLVFAKLTCRCICFYASCSINIINNYYFQAPKLFGFGNADNFSAEEVELFYFPIEVSMNIFSTKHYCFLLNLYQINYFRVFYE